MKIAFDYDGTISEDVEGWIKVMNLMNDRGHEVFVVTFRDKDLDVNDDLMYIEMNYDVYYTGGVAKKWWCEHFGPGEVDVWVDDNPNAVLNNSILTPEEVTAWRRVDKNAA